MPPHTRILPRLLICDLDGTLLNSQGVITEATRTALRQAVDAGIEVAFATGRRHSFAWDVLSPVGLDGATVLISSNGAVVRTFSGKRLHRTSMPPETAILLCRQMRTFRSSLIFTFERTGPGSLVVEDLETLQRTIPRWVASNLPEIECVVPLERAFEQGDDPVQAMICGRMQQMQEAMQQLDAKTPEAMLLREKISVHRTEYAMRDLCIVDLMPDACSKGTAVARLAAERGIAVAEIAAIGDNMNDADMLAFAGQPIVMQNAAPELLEMAYRHGWTLTGSNDEDGAAEAILRILRGRLPAPELSSAAEAVPAD
jgi:hypothetical protein